MIFPFNGASIFSLPHCGQLILIAQSFATRHAPKDKKVDSSKENIPFDDALRRLLNTPPQPKKSAPKEKSKKEKPRK